MNKRLSLRTIIEPRMDAPLPLWMVFPVIFAALYLSHFSLLRLPYYWDEAGYYIPAAWDFFRTGSLIPITTHVECASAAAQCLSRHLVEAFRLLPRSDAGSCVDGGFCSGCLRFGDWRSGLRAPGRWRSGRLC